MCSSCYRVSAFSLMWAGGNGHITENDNGLFGVLQPYLGGRGKVALLAHASAEAAVLPQALQDLQGTAAIHARAAGARRLAAARAAADVRMRGTGQRSPQQEGGAFAAADGGADAVLAYPMIHAIACNTIDGGAVMRG